jgi:hypothetical protein
MDLSKTPIIVPAGPPPDAPRPPAEPPAAANRAVIESSRSVLARTIALLT